MAHGTHHKEDDPQNADMHMNINIVGAQTHAPAAILEVCMRLVFGPFPSCLLIGDVSSAPVLIGGYCGLTRP